MTNIREIIILYKYLTVSLEVGELNLNTNFNMLQIF